MKKTVQYTAFAIVAILFASCSKQQSGSAPSGLQDMVFNAGYCVDGSKTVLSGQDVLWQSTDEIAIYDGTAFNKFTTTSNGSSTALFKGKAAQSDLYYAAYPYDAAVKCDVAARDVFTIVPASQAIPEGGFAEGANISVGRTNDQLLFMYNICGYIKFSLSGSNITRILLETVNGEYIAGETRTRMDTKNRFYSVAIYTKSDAVQTPSSTIEILPVSSETFAPGSYYACVVPYATLSGGIRFTLFDNENKIWEKTIPHLDRINRAEPVNVGIADIGTTRVVKTLALDSSTKTNITPGESAATIYLDTDCTDVTAQVKAGATLADVSVNKVSNGEFAVTFTPNPSDDPVDLKSATIEFTALGADPLEVILNQGGVMTLDFTWTSYPSDSKKTSRYGLTSKSDFSELNLTTSLENSYKFNNTANKWRDDSPCGGLAFYNNGVLTFPAISNYTLCSVKIVTRYCTNVRAGVTIQVKNTDGTGEAFGSHKFVPKNPETDPENEYDEYSYSLDTATKGTSYMITGASSSGNTFITHIYLYYDYDPEPTNE